MKKGKSKLKMIAEQNMTYPFRKRGKVGDALKIVNY